jgi:hypothetical protein
MSKLDAYFKLSEIEQRFNESGAGVRTLASGWMLAALAGLGWLLDPSKSGPWVVPLGLLLSMICTMAVAGIATLWVLDQLVYHRLLDAVFLVGLRMERADRTLPPIHAMMLKTIEGKGTHRWSGSSTSSRSSYSRSSPPSWSSPAPTRCSRRKPCGALAGWQQHCCWRRSC